MRFSSHNSSQPLLLWYGSCFVFNRALKVFLGGFNLWIFLSHVLHTVDRWLKSVVRFHLHCVQWVHSLFSQGSHVCLWCPLSTARLCSLSLILIMVKDFISFRSVTLFWAKLHSLLRFLFDFFQYVKYFYFCFLIIWFSLMGFLSRGSACVCEQSPRRDVHMYIPHISTHILKFHS